MSHLPKEQPTLEQALAIKRIRTQRDFAFVNHWRMQFINKQFSGNTSEEGGRRYDAPRFPGWKEESERRQQAALTPEEHGYLERFESLMDEFEEWEAKKE